MRLSTSSSDPRPKPTVTWAASAVLLTGAAAFLCSLEGVFRYGLPRASRIEGRVAREHAEVTRLGHDGRPGKVAVAVLGNSLLVEGINFPELRAELSPHGDARRFVVEDTAYYDWRYGLARLLSEGARPDLAVLVLSPRQLVSEDFRGSYSAFHLFRGSDVLRAAYEMGLSNTQTADLLISHWSAYFGTRVEVRKWLMTKIFPDLPRLGRVLNPPATKRLDEAELARTAEARLALLDRLVRDHGGRFVLVVPPFGEAAGDTSAAAVRRAGEAAGVTVLAPVPSGSLDPSHYADGFHLNKRGAEVFTTALADALEREINEDALGRGAVAP